MTPPHTPTLCARCGQRPTTRHISLERSCDKCVTEAEQGEIATWPMNVHEQEVGR